jgi:hypothetical protein
MKIIFAFIIGFWVIYGHNMHILHPPDIGEKD